MAAKFSLGSIQLLALKQQLWRLKRHLSKRLLLLEFCSDSLLLAEFQLRPTGDLRLCGFVRESLPSGAVERGVPADPQLMAELVSSLCKEQRLVAHRAIVVLPPEAVHCSSHWLPADLQKSEVQQRLLEPNTPVLLPFPLGQTDFDVLPHTLSNLNKAPTNQLWTILAIASRLSDRILQCLQLAKHECKRIELSSLSLLRLVKPHLSVLSKGQTLLVLEFDRDQTHVFSASSDGPLLTDRLTAIRTYPHGDIEAQGNYPPLSPIDLQAFVADLNHLIDHLQNDAEIPQVVSKIVVTGVNSAHPNLVELLGCMLTIPVIGINVFELPQLDGLDQLSLTESCFFHRICGAALSVAQVNYSTALELDPLSDEEVVPHDCYVEELGEHQDALSDHEQESFEEAMYSDELFQRQELPSQSVSSDPLLNTDLEVHTDKDSVELAADSSLVDGPPAKLSSKTAADGLLPTFNTATSKPTDDPATWPSVGTRRRKTPLTKSAIGLGSESATPWATPDPSESNDSAKSVDSNSFSLDQSTVRQEEPESLSDTPSKPLGQPIVDSSNVEEDVGSSLFSFASGTESSLDPQSKNVVLETDSESDYSLGLGDPD